MKKQGLNLLAWLVTLLFLLPLTWMLAVSLKPEGVYVLGLNEWFNFHNLTLENYRYVLKSSPMLLWTYNSFIIAAISTVLLLAISSLAAFALSKIKFRLRAFVYILIMTGLLIPTEAILIPLYETALHLKLIDSLWGLILPGLTNPLGIFLLKQFMDGIQDEYIEAATLDGCNKFQLWWNICLPLTKAAMYAICIFFFLLSWNSYIWPYICITSQENMVLPTGLPTFVSSFPMTLNPVMAATTLATIPALFVFVLLQKNIVQGVSMAGIKG